MSPQLDDLWYASISSWAGIVGGASHYLVTLHGPSRRITVEWYIDAATAAQWTNRDPSYVWEEGTESNRFNSEAEARRAAVIVFDRVANPSSDLLVIGNRSAVVPEAPIAGAPTHLENLRAITDRADAIGWWDVPSAHREMDRLADQWVAYEREHFNPHPYETSYGSGASKVITESTEFAWGTPRDEEAIDYSIPLVTPPGF